MQMRGDQPDICIVDCIWCDMRLTAAPIPILLALPSTKRPRLIGFFAGTRPWAGRLIGAGRRICPEAHPGSEPGRMGLPPHKYGYLYGSSVELAADPG
jgi:hypothetical protein